MPSAARFAASIRFAGRPALALLVPATAALTVVLAAQPAPAAAVTSAVTAAPAGAVTAAADDSDNGFSWG